MAIFAGGDNHYGVRVYDEDGYDRDVPDVVRALHFSLCRSKPHGDIGAPMCDRAWAVVRRAIADERVNYMPPAGGAS